jgi:hypothetical protein
MMRSIYRWLLRLHPAYFRERFSDEMLSIYDQSAGRMGAFKLVVDGLVSLVRQCVFRPDFWHEPATSERIPFVSAGLPTFFTFDHSRPSNAVLFQATTATGLVFLLISLAIVRGKPSTLFPYYSGIQFADSPSESFREESASSSTRPQATSAERVSKPSISDSEQRRPVSPSSKSDLSRDNRATPPRPVLPSQPAGTTIPRAKGANTGNAIDLNPPVSLAAGPRQSVSTASVERPFESYTGIYVADAADSFSVRVWLEDGRLFMEEPGQKKTGLMAYSESLFIGSQQHCRRIVFSEYREGKFYRLRLDCSGHSKSAHRKLDHQQAP